MGYHGLHMKLDEKLDRAPLARSHRWGRSWGYYLTRMHVPIGLKPGAARPLLRAAPPKLQMELLIKLHVQHAAANTSSTATNLQPADRDIHPATEAFLFAAQA